MYLKRVRMLCVILCAFYYSYLKKEIGFDK